MNADSHPPQTSGSQRPRPARRLMGLGFLAQWGHHSSAACGATVGAGGFPLPRGQHRTRWLTALIGLPLLAVCVWLGGWFLFGVVLAVSLAGLWEFFGLFPGVSVAPIRLASLLFGAAMVWLGFRSGPLAALSVIVAAFWLEELLRIAAKGMPARWLLMASLIYVPGSLQFLTRFSPGETALVFAAVMATDTGAYYAGCLLGGPKIWPSVSPKKTWAGSLGGLAATVAVCLAIGDIWGKAHLRAFALLGVALSVSAQMGDFMESALKRAADMKDSGKLLPGHGGVLDRIDGLLPAILLYALARAWVSFL